VQTVTGSSSKCRLVLQGEATSQPTHSSFLVRLSRFKFESDGLPHGAGLTGRLSLCGPGSRALLNLRYLLVILLDGRVIYIEICSGHSEL
jgi:hypothetical protein